ncbi:SIN3-HDAC complex-associated factor [Cloeon dipterum]|uniref:SIN3-HDAC complex-associated factor n=1 Tax=Cloeon dipterum TaxID=197152 RepID=UPI00321FD59D
MSTFHRPKVYRSSVGCCICKAKSSSSRFTDSKRYEEDFVECFLLSEQRGGEICNACVLLVKRWKKLPAGSSRNWSHVVDARSGPGTNKSLNKFHKRKPKLRANLVLKSTAPKKLQDAIVGKRKKHTYRKQENVTRSTSPASDREESINSDLEDEEMDSTPSSPLSSSGAAMRASYPMLDMTYWRREQTCCGVIFVGRYGELMVDARYHKPCRGGRTSEAAAAPAPTAAAGAAPKSPPPAEEGEETKTLLGKDVDSSSDSGYDDYSSKDAKAVVAEAAAAATAPAAPEPDGAPPPAAD